MFLKRAAFFFLVSFVALFSTFAKQEPVPVWVSDVNSVYGETDYVARIGNGDSKDLAKTEALNYIANYFNTKVYSESVGTRFATTGENSSYSASIAQKTIVVSDIELFGVEYDFYYYKKKKTYYCVAFINRDKYWVQFQPKVENKKREFEKYYDEAESLLAFEPILAKKYFMAAQNAGLEFVDLISMARLIVEERADVYSSDEKRVFEIDKKISDAESRIAIFMDIEGDYSNTVASKTKTIFEKEKYSFTNNRKSSTHIMKIVVDRDHLVSGAGTEFETNSVTPSILLTLFNADGQNLFSYSRKVSKSVAFDLDVALRKGYNNLCKELENDLMENFKQKMLEK